MNWIDEVVGARLTGHKYLAWAGELEFMKASEDDSAGRTVKFRLVKPPEQLGQAHPFAKFTRRRRGKGGSQFEVGMCSVDTQAEMRFDVILINWTSAPQGDSIVFALDYEAQHHPFMGCKRASAEASGTRWMATFIEKADDAELAEQARVQHLEEAKRTGKHQTLSNAARLLTKNPRFWDWLRETAEDIEWTTKDADDWLKDICGIASKAELDADGPEVVAKLAAFHKLRTAFVEWQQAQGDAV